MATKDFQFSVDESSEYAICVGSGRFIRAVLVPVMVQCNYKVIVAQTRGSSFVSHIKQKDHPFYEIDTVLPNGEIKTDCVNIAGVGSLGNPDGRNAFINSIPKKIPSLRIIGLGVTEAGLVPTSTVMNDLAEFLYQYYKEKSKNVISIINTDNMPSNGDVIRTCLQSCDYTVNLTDSKAFTSWLNSNVICHNTMVDRITAARSAIEPVVPRAEPLPSKALVIEDREHVLPSKISECEGVVVRTEAGEIQDDHTLKLQIANATHSAMVYAMALDKLRNTTETPPLVFDYLDLLYQHDILPGVANKAAEANLIYDDWIKRLRHKYFGMSTFFVCQNASVKCKVRLLSNVHACINNSGTYVPSPFVAFAIAALLRFITPIEDREASGVYTGQLSPPLKQHVLSDKEKYTTRLEVDFQAGVYEFCDPDLEIPKLLLLLAENHHSNNNASSVTIASVLTMIDHRVDLQKAAYRELVTNVCKIYSSLMSKSSSCLDVLENIVCASGHVVEEYLTSVSGIRDVVRSEVMNVKVIDVHTHLFPASHGSLMLYGIDDLLTYHYLVAEYLMTAADTSPEEFYALEKTKQANAIWNHLFINRSPISEACRGVITTLTQLGLEKEVSRRDLNAIRKWFDAQDREDYVRTVFRIAKLDYVIMTNIPFDPKEAQYWLGPPYASLDRRYFKAALRVDQLLNGDWDTISIALTQMSFEKSLKGLRLYLRQWIERMEPEYFMASVPHTFTYPEEEDNPSSDDVITRETLLLNVLLPLAQELHLPIALKFDSVRSMNPRLKTAGDGVTKTPVSVLTTLCRNHPDVKFLATFLSRVNQHEVCVLANKFSNLHIYGCWWYCNNPSIIDELTRMRVEILGTGFTCQHSDARVLDQLIYKWHHSRQTISDVLIETFTNLHEAGWKLSKREIKRDVKRLFGGSYQEFMAK